jgi:hypothetical protein
VNAQLCCEAVAILRELRTHDRLIDGTDIEAWSHQLDALYARIDQLLRQLDVKE